MLVGACFLFGRLRSETGTGAFSRMLCDEMIRDGRLASFAGNAETHDFYRGKPPPDGARQAGI